MNPVDRFRFAVYAYAASGCMFFAGLTCRTFLSFGRIGAAILLVPLLAAAYFGFRANQLWRRLIDK